MRQPKRQAEFFKLLSRLLYYMVSGNSNIGYLAKDEWNPYFKAKKNLQVSLALVFADSLKRPMYDCIIVKPYREEDEILDAEGDLDGESDASDIDMREIQSHQNGFSHSVSPSTRDKVGSRLGSPMDEG
jgi:hypothetical protein